jgi:asparagine synthase (glutamine-hydrolysing)
MCGIAGIHYKHGIAADVPDRAAAHFARSLSHRGPDAFGAHRTPRAVYANLRLAIVDRAGGNQPIYAPDGRRGIVYNGEVYNHAELRERHERRWPFATLSDTEAILAAVVHEGPAAFEQFNGMFGLCIWDDEDGSFLLARDRFGAKPLYVYEDEHCIAFASELRTLLGLEGLDHGLNPIGFQDYLAFRYNLAPHTQFARIQKLPAGCWLRFDGRSRHVERYAAVTMEDGQALKSEASYVEELDALLESAVRSQLMGEVPIGVLLSGGLDSSAIAAYVHRAGARLKAYSIGFPEVNEFAFSRDVARRFELDYTELSLGADELRAGMDGVIAELDEPIADPACFALSRLCREIRRDVTVVLSGEGGDELFAGYGHHQLALHGSLGRDELFGHFFVQSANHLDANALLRDKSLPLHHLRHRAAYDRAATPLAGMQAFELATWMPENLMMKADKVLMAHSLEGRFPFLDLGVYRFASTLPRAMKLPHALSSKHVLRQLLRPQLPASVIERRKMGFTVPTPLFLQPLERRLGDAVAALRGTPVAEVLDLSACQALIDRYYRGEPVSPLKLWNLAVLLLWWADVYPTLRARPRPIAAPAAVQPQKLVVYTALIGSKEALNDPLEALPAGAATDLDIDWVCFTDQTGLRSPTWRFVPIGDRHLPAEKLSRRPKALPHEYFPQAEYSLYVDNTVGFKRLPQSSDLIAGGEYLFRAFRHATRHNPEEEAAAVACLGYDDVGVICAQMDFYAKQKPLGSITPLTTATVLLRSHHHASVKRFGRLWWESLLAFSKRDQLSFDYARQEAGVEVDYWAGTTDHNPFIHWNGSLSRLRVQASFDAKRYAWVHRGDAAAAADPKAHYLAHGVRNDPRWNRSLPLLEYACYRNGSSLGAQVSPRRGMADTLDALLAPQRRDSLRYLVVRVQNSADERAFAPAELDAATRSISATMGKAQGTALDLSAADLRADGKVYTTAQAPYELVLLIGLPGAQLEAAVGKLIRLIHPERGSLVLLLTSSAPLAQAAAAEGLIAATLGARTQAALHASRHDDLPEPVANSVVGFSWCRIAVTAKTGAPA